MDCRTCLSFLHCLSLSEALDCFEKLEGHLVTPLSIVTPHFTGNLSTSNDLTLNADIRGALRAVSITLWHSLHSRALTAGIDLAQASLQALSFVRRLLRPSLVFKGAQIKKTSIPRGEKNKGKETEETEREEKAKEISTLAPFSLGRCRASENDCALFERLATGLLRLAALCGDELEEFEKGEREKRERSRSDDEGKEVRKQPTGKGREKTEGETELSPSTVSLEERKEKKKEMSEKTESCEEETGKGKEENESGKKQKRAQVVKALFRDSISAAISLVLANGSHAGIIHAMALLLRYSGMCGCLVMSEEGGTERLIREGRSVHS